MNPMPVPTEETAGGDPTRSGAPLGQLCLTSGDTATLDTLMNTGAYSTSSYDGDEGTPLTSSSSTSGDPVQNHGIGAGNFNDIRSSTSSVISSPEAKVRIQTVSIHSVANSIVENDSPMPPHYLHSSNPTNIHKQFATKKSSKSSHGKMERSSVGTIGIRPQPSHYSQSSASDGDDGCEVTDGGVDPDKIRDQVLSRRPSAPIPIIDPIFSVVYDSAGSSRTSQIQAPDLFPRPLVLKKWPRKTPHSPANTVATPKPLISVIPPTPLAESSNTSNLESVRTAQAERIDAYDSITVIAHTGASTPEESIVESRDLGIRSLKEGGGTMTDFSFEEGDEELGTPPEISTPPTYPENSPDIPDIEQGPYNLGPEVKHQMKIPAYYTREQLNELAVYSDSDLNLPPANHIPHSLYEEYILSDPHRSASKISKATSRSQTRRASASRERGEVLSDELILPMSTGSFARIITDLENMLNQALELAGRAVVDSHTALEQRDASIRSVRSLRESICDSEGTLGHAKAESFRTANDQNIDEEIVDEPANPVISNDLRQTLSRGSSTLAVYRDSSDQTSDAENDENVKTRGRGKTSISESEVKSRRMRSLPGRTVAERDLERSRSSRIPRPTRKSTLNSIRLTSSADYPDDQDKLNPRSEVGRQNKRFRVHQPPPTARVDVIQRKKGGWDWGLGKKRWAASASCAVVVLIAFTVGVYGGESDAIQASLGITASLTSLGNVLFIIGVAIPSLCFWPLSLLHGRKPYTLLSIALTIPLQIPQALSLPPHTILSQGRSMVPFVICVLFFRTISGFVLGFASMNALATLVDLFGPDAGACCRGGVVFNSNVPVEGQDQFHLVPGGEAGARIGVWLGIWAWLFFAFGGVGFLIGRLIVTKSSPAWGFWIVAIVASILLFLVWLVPEVRPPWRKRRVVSRRRTTWKGKDEKPGEDRGEITMVVSGKSPKWWWEEVRAGIALSLRMCKQLGFLVMTVYVGWIAGEVAMVFNLLTTLETGRYSFNAVDTGLAILALSIGAVMSVPVQLSPFYLRNFRHRVHHRGQLENKYHYHEGQHPYRTVFLISVFLVPAASLGFTISATGPPIHFVLPVLFAGLVAFSGTLAIAECHLIIMENFDISNLPTPLMSSFSGSITYGDSDGGRPHGTQQPRSLIGTNNDFTTCHPAITAAFGILQFASLGAIAGAVGWSRYIANGIGVRNGLGIFTGITFLATIALIGVLWRWKEVRVLEVYTDRDPEGQPRPEARLTEELRICKISIFQRGRFTRWSEVNEMVYKGDEERDAWGLVERLAT